MSSQSRKPPASAPLWSTSPVTSRPGSPRSLVSKGWMWCSARVRPFLPLRDASNRQSLLCSPTGLAGSLRALASTSQRIQTDMIPTYMILKHKRDPGWRYTFEKHQHTADSWDLRVTDLTSPAGSDREKDPTWTLSRGRRGRGEPGDSTLWELTGKHILRNVDWIQQKRDHVYT